MKITPSDPLHQEYLTIILGVLVIDNSCSCLYWGSVSDGGADSLTQSLTESFTHSLSKENAGAGAECCQFSFQTLVQLVRMAPTVLYSGCKGQRAVMAYSSPRGVKPMRGLELTMGSEAQWEASKKKLTLGGDRQTPPWTDGHGDY